MKEAGLSFRRQERSLFARCREVPVDITFLRTEDIPVLCAEGAIDMGITGGDLIAESGVDLVHRLDLKVGECRLAVCVPDDSPLKNPAGLAGHRVATSFPRVTEEYLRGHGVTAHLVTLSGLVEIMIALGVADAIVDLVETGSTLAANRLRILTEIGRYQTVAGAKCRPARGRAGRSGRPPAGRRDHRPHVFAVGIQHPRAKLPQAEKITPGFNSPTINSLEDPAWCSVKVMVQRGDVISIMERLETLGASAI